MANMLHGHESDVTRHASVSCSVGTFHVQEERKMARAPRPERNNRGGANARNLRQCCGSMGVLSSFVMDRCVDTVRWFVTRLVGSREGQRPGGCGVLGRMWCLLWFAISASARGRRHDLWRVGCVLGWWEGGLCLYMCVSGLCRWVGVSVGVWV